MTDKTAAYSAARRKTSSLTPARLKEVLSYDPATGHFIWLITRGRCRCGATAGVESDGYILIGIDGAKYQAHHLAWLYMTGEWAPGLLDHENTIRSDNRWDNIRQATRSQNNANCAVRSHSKTGLKGVQRHRSGRFVAKIQIKRKQVYLGIFDTPEEAHAVYLVEAKAAFGDHARSA
jgi:hypothetical protein